jgi:hypothetical protein
MIQRFMQIVCLSAGAILAASLLFAESPTLLGLVAVMLLALITGSAWLHRLNRHGGRLRGNGGPGVRVIQRRRVPPQILPREADTDGDDQLPLI